MKAVPLTVILLVAWASAAIGQEFRDDLPSASQGKTWKMVWHDEFDGETLDQTKWVYRPDGKRKDGWWDRKTVSHDGQGHLAIRTIKEGDKVLDGCVTTQGKFEHAFGYYVARIQLQKQPGHWSAFWLTCNGVRNIGSQGRDGSEIDIMEEPWLDERLNHAIHWDYGQPKSSVSTKVSVPGIMDGWHTYSVLWTAEEYVFYVDGKETWRSKAGGVCQVPVYILLSDEVGKWAGDINKAQLPDQFLVDYVRVYDLVDAK